MVSVRSSATSISDIVGLEIYEELKLCSFLLLSMGRGSFSKGKENLYMENQGEEEFIKIICYISTFLSQRGATEHSSTCPRFSTHNLLIVLMYVYRLQINWETWKKKKHFQYRLFIDKYSVVLVKYFVPVF
jgi:hypothetical protein